MKSQIASLALLLTLSSAVTLNTPVYDPVEAFGLMDTSGDGLVDREELYYAQHDKKIKQAAKVAEQISALQAELLPLQKRQAKLQSQLSNRKIKTEKTFIGIDTNKDQFIDQEEFIAAVNGDN